VEELSFYFHFLLFDLKFVSKVFSIEAKVDSGLNPTLKEFEMGNVNRCGPRYTEFSSMQLLADTLPLFQGKRKGIHASCNTSVVSDRSFTDLAGFRRTSWNTEHCMSASAEWKK
jgi:hypothetical protein